MRSILNDHSFRQVNGRSISQAPHSTVTRIEGARDCVSWPERNLIEQRRFEMGGMRTTTRREFVTLAVGTTGCLALRPAWAADGATPYDLVAATDRARILAAANRYLSDQAVTVTASHSD